MKKTIKQPEVKQSDVKVKVVRSVEISPKELDYLGDFFSENVKELTYEDQKVLLKIYNRVFNLKRQHTQCVPCWKGMLDELHLLYNQLK